MADGLMTMRHVWSSLRGSSPAVLPLAVVQPDAQSPEHLLDRRPRHRSVRRDGRATRRSSVTNNQTGAVRDVVSGGDGAATISALSLTGTYTVTRDEAGLRHRGAQRRRAARRRDGDAAGEAARRIGEVRGHGLRHGRRASAPTRRSDAGSTARPSTRRRSSAARSARCRCSTPRSARPRAPATCSSTPPTSSPAPAAAAPRPSRSMA